MSDSKKIPYALSKQELVKLCYPIPEYTIRNRINLIIYDNRKNLPEFQGFTMSKIISSHYIQRVDLIEFFETYGYPENYEDKINQNQSKS